MKHTYYAIVLAGLLIGQMFQQAQAQENIIKINPLALFVLTGNIQYEHVVNDMSSVQLGVFFTGFSFGSGADRVGYSGVGVTPEYRFYLTNKVRDVPRGFYIGPYARYMNFSFDVQTNNGSGGTTGGKIKMNSFGGGAILGFQFVNDSGFVVDLFIGPGLKSTNWTGDPDQQDEVRFFSSSSIGFRSGMALGFAF
jgi:hypothetical protein